MLNYSRISIFVMTFLFLLTLPNIFANPCPGHAFRYVYSVLPPADEDLKGSEVQAIIKFKRALGLDDVDAANMHMEVLPCD